MAKKSDSNIIAVITMIFLFGMISFVTNLAAPIGNIWKMQPGIEGSNTWGMMGNMMNFLAYAIMGIPAGNLLKKKGYKFTALAALQAAGSTDGAAVMAVLPGVEIDGVSGHIKFDETGDAIRTSAFIKTINNETGAWEFVAEQTVE